VFLFLKTGVFSDLMDPNAIMQLLQSLLSSAQGGSFGGSGLQSKPTTAGGWQGQTAQAQSHGPAPAGGWGGLTNLQPANTNYGTQAPGVLGSAQGGGAQGIMQLLQKMIGGQGGQQQPASRATWGMGMRSPSMNRIF
jgi:hypothetical protein